MTAPAEPRRIIDAGHAMTEDGWRKAVRIVVGADARIASIRSIGPDDAEQPGHTGPAIETVDLLLPGMPNAHCHSFQRAIAGRTERAGLHRGSDGQVDSFWTWREQMYRAIDQLDADGVRRTATSLYQDLKRRGYTSVAEFHYLHRPGDSSAIETAAALVDAAAAADVDLLLLPVLYCRGGLDGAPLSARQQRFGLPLDAYGELLQALAGIAARNHRITVGVAPHSLRAVSPDDLAELMKLRDSVVPGCPVHIHVSEQEAEVDAVRRQLGATPIEWLCANAPVDRHWVLVHATHATADELHMARQRDAVICICTTTEANLGDGIFDIQSWWSLGGSLAIGSDSNVGLDPTEELRWLEYQSRLKYRKRSLLVEPNQAHPGSALWRRAVAGGRQALGRRQVGLSVGAPAELLALSVSDAGLSADEAIDDWIFAGRAVSLTTQSAPP